MRPAKHHTAPVATTAAMGTLLAAVGFAILQTQPAAAAEQTRFPLESAAWLSPTSETPAALPSVPVNAQSKRADVSALQTRLEWTGLPADWTDGTLDRATTAAVKSFQSRQQMKPTGRADASTVARLKSVARDGKLDSRCQGTGITICVDKTQKVTRYLKDGKVIKTMDAQFGPEKGDKGFGQYSRTREGVFKVKEKQRHTVSSLYGYDLPWWMQFDGGEGFHYSGYFDQAGFKVNSYGCIISDSKADSAWLFNHTPRGTKVVIYH
ncbi:MAG: L,D-transpeptidase family protein [Candidatus Nanopelagicales bacterium]